MYFDHIHPPQLINHYPTSHPTLFSLKKKKSGPICVAQIFLGMRPALEHGQHTRSHPQRNQQSPNTYVRIMYYFFKKKKRTCSPTKVHKNILCLTGKGFKNSCANLSEMGVFILV